MKPTIISPIQQRQRKALLILPLLVIPFMTLLFWAFGGGKGTAAKAEPSKAGFNMRLPDAKPKDQPGLDKMSYYDLAAKDSAKLAREIKSDPYYKSSPNRDSAVNFTAVQTVSPMTTPRLSAGASEVQIRKKLAEIQAAMGKREPPEPVRTTEKVPVASPPAMQPDPELRQMNGLLEKILDIQHPERVKRVDPSPAVIMKPFRGIPAVVDGTQHITQGTVIRLKLTDSVTLGGHLFEKGQLIYGSGNLSNQRYTLSIKSIRVGNAFYPVDLTVFDQVDGLEGISVPEAVTGDALREGAAGGVGGMEIMSLDPSMSAQLAGAGINAAKGLFSKKMRRIKGKIKNGHPLLLRINGEPK